MPYKFADPVGVWSELGKNGQCHPLKHSGSFFFKWYLIRRLNLRTTPKKVIFSFHTKGAKSVVANPQPHPKSHVPFARMMLN